ncbi:MAG: transposase [Verrucomicrobiaceae bacterium]|nr:transposase [Verrucomicrobiaceae bacterium]
MGAAQAAALKKSRAVSNKGGRPQITLALVFDALFYRLRNCGPWRDLPLEYGPWQTIYGWHRAFARNGLWLALLKSFVRKVRGHVVLVDG